MFVSIFLCVNIFLNFTFNLFFNLLTVQVFNFHAFVKFLNFLLLLVSSFIPLWSKTCLITFQSFFICWYLFYGLNIIYSRECFRMWLKRMWVLLLLDGMMCLKGQFGVVWVQCPLLVFCLMVCHWWTRGFGFPYSCTADCLFRQLY